VPAGSAAAVDRLPGLSSIYIADVRHSGWTELSASVLGLQQLVVLNAGHNELTQVADGVTPEHVGVLNLSFNRLASLPAALGSSPVLQQMYLANNELTDLPESFSQLPMVDLFLSENRFTTIPKVGGQHVVGRCPAGVQQVVSRWSEGGRCTAAGLSVTRTHARAYTNTHTHTPQAVFGMEKLSKLSVACCRLASVPERWVASLQGPHICTPEVSDWVKHHLRWRKQTLAG
jgi:Leucine-rich repeat (LRR) protein